MNLRPLMALALLASFATSSLEAVAGLVRDGEVHHESTATAAVHAVESTGEHGHEGAQEGFGEEHGPDHEHGTGSDHCTHAHGNALAPTPAAPAWAGPGVVIPTPPSRVPPGPDFRPLLHPPRA